MHIIHDVAGSPVVAPLIVDYSFASRTLLTCISSEGPPTEVTWTRNNVSVSESISIQQQQLMDVTNATYHNTLIVNSSNISDYNGIFRCTVKNRRGSSAQSVSIKCKMSIAKYTLHSYYLDVI